MNTDLEIIKSFIEDICDPRDPRESDVIAAAERMAEENTRLKQEIETLKGCFVAYNPFQTEQNITKIREALFKKLKDRIAELEAKAGQTKMVKCKECETYGEKRKGYCSFIGKFVEPEDFCSFSL